MSSTDQITGSKKPKSIDAIIVRAKYLKQFRTAKQSDGSKKNVLSQGKSIYDMQRENIAVNIRLQIARHQKFSDNLSPKVLKEFSPEISSFPISKDEQRSDEASGKRKESSSKRHGQSPREAPAESSTKSRSKSSTDRLKKTVKENSKHFHSKSTPKKSRLSDDENYKISSNTESLKVSIRFPTALILNDISNDITIMKMIDEFTKNIESLSKREAKYDDEGDYEMLENRKRKLKESFALNLKRQKLDKL